MSQDIPRARPAGGSARRSKALVPTLVVLGVLAILYFIFVSFWTDRLWFDSVDFTNVFTTQLVTRGALFVIFGVLMAAAVVASAWVAYRLRPLNRPMSMEQQSLERYRQAIDPVRTWVVAVAAGLLGVISGASASSQWQTFLAWRNGGEFGQKDPQFNTDLGFYAFDYPWWRYLLSFGFAVVVLSLIVAAVAHYIYGGVRLQAEGDRVSPGAQAHLSVLLGLFVLLKAGAYFLDRYGLLLKDNKLFTGGSYTDINAQLPAKTILIFVALICAVILFANAWQRNWMLPGIGVGLLVLSAILLSGLWPFIVQQFQVDPTEENRERPYISDNIEATRDAYDIADVEVDEYRAETTPLAGQLAEDAETIPGVRLMDPTIIQPAFQQLQQVRGFYHFADPLDVDRYEIDGREQDIVIAAREIDNTGIPEGQQNWLNEHTVYTHGYGVVAAYGNQRQSDGSPSWAEEDIPSEGELSIDEPRIYFGESSPEYSIVGAPEGSDAVEFDVPEDPETGDERHNIYGGDGGVPVGSFFNKLFYATKYQEANIMLSDRVNSESTILYDRDPRERVEKVAPWLTADGNPYPTVVDGKIVWVVDGYTTLNSMPYSQRVSLQDATEDSRVQLPGQAAQAQDHVNYIRNSVKATVDAYDGTVTLYEWDENDPVLDAWKGAFPDTVTPKDEIPEELLAHLRYPEDLFKTQRTMLEQYHVENPTTFYGGQDRWVIPEDPANEGFDQPPYYQTIQMPETDGANFSLTSTFTPRGRQNLVSFMAVNADARSPDYGKLQILRLPGTTQIDGPGQVANSFESDPDVAEQLTQLRLGDARTLPGNLLTLPVGGGLLYVQPIYVQRETAGESSFPLLRRVLVQFGGEIGFAATLQEALDQVFGGESGAETDEGAEAQPPPEGEGEQPPPDEGDGQTSPALQQAIEDAQQAWTDAQEAQADARWDDYGEALQRMEDALERAARLSNGG